MIEYETVESAGITGVVWIITGPGGNVFVGTCFDPCPAAGLSTAKWQQRQAENAARKDLWKRSVSTYFADIFSIDSQSAVSQLLRKEGWSQRCVSIGETV